MDGKGVQAVVKVAAETSRLHVAFEVAIGRRNDADVDLARTRGAERAKFALLQHAQKFDLKGRRGFADFVEKDRPAVGQFEQADAVLIGAGIGALLAAEKLAFEKLVRQGAAILDDKGLVAARRAEMDGAGEQFLARARGAGDQDGNVILRRLARHGQSLDHRSAGLMHDAAEFEHPPLFAPPFGEKAIERLMRRLGVAAAAARLLLHPVKIDRVAHAFEQFFRVPGLGDILIDAGLVDAGDNVLRF